MKTRFLTDFFNSSAASQRLQTIDFLRFPPPVFPSSDHFNFDNISCFEQLDFINASIDIARFSVNESLNKFLSDVLPQHVNTEIDQKIEKEVTSEEKIKEDGTANINFTLVEFETPELCISLENSCLLHEEKIHFFFEVTDTEFSTDLLDFSHDMQQIVDVHKSICCVEDISLDIQEEHKSDLFNDGSLVKGQISLDLRSFPVLEVDEISLGINSYMFEDKHMIFESNEYQQWMHKDELTCDSKELLLSSEFDIMETLLNHSSFKSHEYVVPHVIDYPEYIINAIEDQLSPLALEQLQFFDMNPSHFSQMFSAIEFISEVEICEQMFSNTTLSNFNDLIVTHELVLTDDSFKSLPVPIISDHKTILPVQTIIEEIFIKLKLQPSSTSDDIYLDWHLLEEDICNHSKRTPLKMFEDIDTYCINADINSCDSLMLVLEFVLSDGCSNVEKKKENIEVLNIEKFGNLMEHVCHDGIVSSETCKKMASEENLVGTKVNQAHRLVESMSQFDDLDFFLNPLEATYVKRQKSADKILEMDCALPVVSANNPTESHDTSRKQQQCLENEIHSRGDFQATSILNQSSKKLEGPLHSTHIEGNYSMKALEATYEVPNVPIVMESKKINTSTPTFPDAIIIVNTRDGEADMIISRRSTYQKILAMEKQGVQIVERDLNLPVDIIISAAVCIVLYDSKNIRKKTHSSDDASLLSSFVEIIAANVLTSLSFALSSCILIFEGEVGFLSGIMESSDELYAAAASLGIDLQLFYSYSCEATDEIIVNCITHAANSTRGLYPRMSESETLAESFLSKFTSLNPLSGHAILSSVRTLMEFFEMSHQQRVSALKKYLVPEASITLFSSLCRYGEREDSRSGMTDCCSSVSSGHDSGYCCPKYDHEPKKRKYIESPVRKAMPVDHMFQFEKTNDVLWDPPKSVNTHRFWKLEAEEISDGTGKSNAANFDEIYFSKNENPDARMMLNHPSLTETSFGQSKKVYVPIVDKLGSHTNQGEIIDIDDNAMAGDDFSFLHPEKSSDWFSLPSFSTTAEINSDLDSWIPTKDNRETTSEGYILNSQSGLMNNITPFKEKDQCYGRTPLSKAIYSDQPQKGSPWTIDFLNRVKEKSRMRHQSLPNMPAPCFGYSGSSSKFRKRKSPSILDFYRYTSSSTVKSTEHKGQKGPIQAPSSSKSVKIAPFSSQTWTPIDKRAKRKLTFATKGSKGQSKLIWSDKANQTMNGTL
ncbi:hypothetical protein QVD17_07401 [Tagetes erecta]|uniref:Protein SHORTAGE IN CHIASMATA 1 n=1 Tax=Tagetes erecta TaxID=13708 RepID=A0AAD8P7D8_TARER|nr:hypothetical protein QVD17_07401 [Tagetes erecta]